MRAQAKPQSNFERVVFDPGTYTMTLTKAMVMMGKPTKFSPTGAPKIMMVWHLDGGSESDEVVEFLGFPKGFAYNEKGNFWKRLGEIAGVKITSENAETVDIDLGSFIQSYDELLDHINSKNDQGNNEKAEVKGLSVGDQQLLGKTCQLVLKIWTSENGTEGNEIATVMQVGGGAGPRRPQPRAAAPQQQSRPPARPAVEPLRDDSGEELPY